VSAPAPRSRAAGAERHDGAERHGGAEQVVLVRHAETEWSRCGRHTGRTDVPLTDAGRDAARALRGRLSRWRFELVLVSPLWRAMETCELAGLAGRAQPRDELLEWDYGDYEGLTTAQILQTRPGWDLWRDGCPNGERADDVGARADRVIAQLRDAPSPAAVFAHGHVLRVLGACWCELSARDGGRLGLSTGALCVLAHEHRRPIIERWNL
jgi:broad specificity phosphatase PhoE